MLKRLLLGFFIGAVVGIAAATALASGLSMSSFDGSLGALWAYGAAAATGALTGLVAGKPIWAAEAKVEAGLKAFFGALLAAGAMFALRGWGGGRTRDLTAPHGVGPRPVGELLCGGVLVLPWRVCADALVHGPPGARGVALTFDDGPDRRWTPVVLELLAARNLSATFFVVGRKVDDHPHIVRDIIARGHAVGIHSYEHDRLFALRGQRRVRRDLERAIASVERATGLRSRLFRPPIGQTNPVIARVAEELDLEVVGWSARGLDGLRRTPPETVASRIDRGLRDGAIVLLHDAPETGDAEPPGVRALPLVLDAIASRGLDVVPLVRWLEEAYGDAAGRTT